MYRSSFSSLLSLRLQRVCTFLVSTANHFVTKSLSDLQLWTLPALETLMCTNLVKLMFKKSAENGETRVLLQRSFLSIVGFTAYHLACEMSMLYIRHHQKLAFVSLTINPTVFLLANRIRVLHWVQEKLPFALFQVLRLSFFVCDNLSDLQWINDILLRIKSAA